MKNKKSVHRMALSALVAAIYAALTRALGFMSYNGIQFRVAEALCVLPFFFPFTTWGLFVGCILANLHHLCIAQAVVGDELEQRSEEHTSELQSPS